MTHLIIFILSGMLLLASGAKAEIINLYCEISKDKESTITIGNKTNILGNPVSGIEIIIDTKNEKIVEAPRRGSIWAKNLHVENWSSSIISWGTKPGFFINFEENYYLNRYTLKLTNEKKEEFTLQKSYYDCNKTKKKK